jgi:hypothetical protein
VCLRYLVILALVASGFFVQPWPIAASRLPFNGLQALPCVST